MIEKLEPIKEFDCSDTPQAKMQHHSYHNDCIKKINELVDAVNELQTRPENVQPVAETRPENVQDKFAEQRKCICKLCWFWHDDKTDKVVGILTGVFDEADRPFERNIDQTLYKNCEPVKPDDDIIYQGGDNEKN